MLRTTTSQRIAWMLALAAPHALEAWALLGAREHEDRLTFTRLNVEGFRAHTLPGRITHAAAYGGLALWFIRHTWTRGVARAHR